MIIRNEYRIVYKGSTVGFYYVFSGGSAEYRVYSVPDGVPSEELERLGAAKGRSGKKPFPPFSDLIRDENRVQGRKQPIYESGGLRAERIAQETGEKFYVYRHNAEKGDECYSSKDHSAPHFEGPREVPGMSEWCTWYAFSKMDDGTFEAELDESWYGGGGHNDGGTIRRPIPEEWFALPYNDFLEKLLDLCSARHYQFTADDLAARYGLKRFFGYDRIAKRY